LAEVSLLVIHLDLRNETQQILCLFHTLHITDAKVALVVLFLQGTILDMGSGISEYTGEHLAAIERTVHIAHKLQLHGIDVAQTEAFEAGMLFARVEGIIPAPESCHAIAATIREAKKATEEGKNTVILFCLSGHGLIDMPSYESYINGDLHDYKVSDEEINKFLQTVPQVD
jgi:threonine synthase